MTTKRSAAKDPSVCPFTFESYGVKVRIDGNLQDLVDEAESIARRSLLGCVTLRQSSKVDLSIEMNRPRSTYYLIQDGEEIASGRSRKKFFKFFDSLIKASVGERAVDRVFLHAGVVGWKGKAIVLPANSFKGKSTLVAELVRQGATYFSDDFAIFDKDGFVHAFPRPLGMRSESGRYREYQLTPESLGGTTASGPMPVGFILFTEYQPGRKWNPVIISPGNGVLELIPFALTFRHRPEFSLGVLNKVSSRAIIASSPRGTARDFAELMLNFVDKNVN